MRDDFGWRKLEERREEEMLLYGKRLGNILKIRRVHLGESGSPGLKKSMCKTAQWWEEVEDKSSLRWYSRAWERG